MLLGMVAVGAEGVVAGGGGGGSEALGELAGGGGRVRLGGVVDGCYSEGVSVLDVFARIDSGSLAKTRNWASR